MTPNGSGETFYKKGKGILGFWIGEEMQGKPKHRGHRDRGDALAAKEMECVPTKG